MADRLLTADDLAARFGISRSQISRWQSSGRLPAPATGPLRRGVRWSEAAIKAWEAAGFVTDTESWRADLKTVDFASKCMAEVIATDGVHETAKGLARAGMRLLSNPLVPLKARVSVARNLLNDCDWSKALGEMDADDRERAIRVSYLLGKLHRKHGGKTNAS